MVGNLSPGPPDGAYAVLWATDTQPAEVAALENGRLRRLSHQNDGWLKVDFEGGKFFETADIYCKGAMERDT